MRNESEFTSAGIDIGSRTVKLVMCREGKIIEARKSENSFDTLEVCRRLLDGLSYHSITATGYGRHLFAEYYQTDVISEIKAFALGVKAIFPGCRTILDIGGQDTKAISLNPDRGVRKFEMNDKCAAGTGKFLEIMSIALRYPLNEFGEKALQAEKCESINSMCTVFAESEVVSLIAKGKDRPGVAKGIHQSIVNRSVSLLNRVGIEDDLVFVGGVALNPCIRQMLSEKLGRKIHTPDDPQMMGAFGCALNAGKHFE